MTTGARGERSALPPALARSTTVLAPPRPGHGQYLASEPGPPGGPAGPRGPGFPGVPLSPFAPATPVGPGGPSRDGSPDWPDMAFYNMFTVCL